MNAGLYLMRPYQRLRRRAVKVYKILTLNSGKGSWIFIQRHLNKYFFKWSVARQVPAPYRYFIWYASVANSVLRVVPAGRYLFRWSTRKTFGRLGCTLCISALGNKYYVHSNDPRSCVVPGEVLDFTTRLSARLASEADVIIDVGANYGSFSNAVNQLKPSPQRRVIAFEPNPVLIEPLIGNLRGFGVVEPEVVWAAVGKERSDVQLQIMSHNSGETRLASMAGNQAEYSQLPSTLIQVRQTLLDDLLIDKAATVFVKIDVEGGEYRVLTGALDFLRRHQPRIALEVNARRLEAAGDSIDEMIALLRSSGYSEFSHERCNVLHSIESLAQKRGQQDIILFPESPRSYHSASGRENIR